jgi:hypothetical protein
MGLSSYGENLYDPTFAGLLHGMLRAAVARWSDGAGCSHVAAFAAN